MSDTILVDECLSVALVAVAKARGIPAVHAAHIGKGGWQDWNLVPFALANDYIVATNNRRHFLKEYLEYDLHNGVIIVVPNVDRDDQIDLFQRALDVVVQLGADTANKIIEVLLDGSVHVRAWTSGDHDPEHVHQPRWA
jgi:predicted nuclease of predicted toxin-antitoxin system